MSEELDKPKTPNHWLGKKHHPRSIKKLRATQLVKYSDENSDHQKGEKNSQFGTCWITKAMENKKIKKDELAYYEAKGWIKGRMVFTNVEQWEVYFNSVQAKHKMK